MEIEQFLLDEKPRANKADLLLQENLKANSFNFTKSYAIALQHY
jgi:hypothetical protein